MRESWEEWRGRHGGLARGVSFLRRFSWMVGSNSGGAKRYRAEKEKEKRASVGGGGGGGLSMSSSSRRVAGMWMALVIIGLSGLMLLNNATMIGQHVEIGLNSRAGMADLFWFSRGRGKVVNMMVLPEVERKVLKPHPCERFTVPPPPADPKRTGPRPCPVCYLDEDLAISQLPAEGTYQSPILKRLTFVSDPDAAKRPSPGAPGSAFGGYPSLEDRAASFNVREEMKVHCGFVKGPTPGLGTGYDFDEDDREVMLACRGVVVASAIFGNYDQLQQPKNVSDEAKKSVCFFMFVDEETETSLDDYDNFRTTKQVGLWRVVVVRNLPYRDARRTGKIPKLLLHRLFPNVRFSIWADGKLELVQDPYKILERFLWRTNETFAISQHYKRFDVFEEAEANKVAAKYNNKSIDDQINFYKKEGLTPYSSVKLPITSDVPEGCVIIREHTPMANLMSCLWFNEVDRFTSRDQLSFGIVRDKLMAAVPWRVSMFKDCERRNFVVQAYHRDLLVERGLLPGANSSKIAEVKEVISDPSPVAKPVVKKHVSSGRHSSIRRKRSDERRPGFVVGSSASREMQTGLTSRVQGRAEISPATLRSTSF